MKSGDEEFLSLLQTRYARGELSPGSFERMKSFLTDRTSKSHPGDSDIWKSTGNIFFKQKDYNNALKCYEIAVEIDHDNIAALNNIGMAYRILGRNEDAETIFEYIKMAESEQLVRRMTVGPSVSTPTPIPAQTPKPEYTITTPPIPPSIPDQVTTPGRSYNSDTTTRGPPPADTNRAPGEEKSPGLAIVLAFFFGGLGQVYNGRLGKGLAIFFGQILGFAALLVPGFIIWIYSIYDAYTTSKRMNRGEIPYKPVSTRDLVIYFAVVIGVFILVVTLIILMILPLLSPVTHTSSASYSRQFTNPGFETGNLAGWTSGSKVSVPGDRSHSGKYSGHFDMSGTENSDYISQNVDLTNAKSITFWGMGEGNNWPFYIYIDGKPVQTSDAVPDTWTRYTVPVSGYPGVHIVSLRWNGGPGMYGADIDDFSVS
jgi:TM2 domain-containing membrane protein YozV